MHVEPSLGQIIKGFSIIFVGTTDDLTSLIHNSLTQGNLVNLDYHSESGALSPHPTEKEILETFWDIR